MYIQYQPNRLASGIDITAVAIHLNLFFLRIMMEHCFFIETGFTTRDRDMAAIMEDMKNAYGVLLGQAIVLADGVVRQSAIESRQFYTPYTVRAEQMTAFLTGIPFDTSLTNREKSMQPDNGALISPGIDEGTRQLNHAAYRLTKQLADFKKNLLIDIVKCRAYTTNYPMELHHMWVEANRYMQMLEELDKGKNIMRLDNLKDDEAFWSHIMADHSKFIAMRLDMTETESIQEFMKFANIFDALSASAKSSKAQQEPNADLSKQTLAATEQLQDFQIKSTQGIMECKIQGIIPPVRADHILRETYYFLWLLHMAQKAAY